jgi:subtilisin family serine protease
MKETRMRLRRSVTALSVVATLAAFAAMPTPPAFADSTTDTYIVQLKSGVSADKMTGKLMGANAKVIHKVFQGGIAKLTAAQAQALAANPDVKSVHKDAIVKATDTQTNSPWDLDMLDSRTATLDQTYTYPNNGSSVTVYVLDSGIMRSHAEFASATISTGYDFVDGDTTPQDCNGHGTSVSSLIAGATLGASKGVTLVPLRVLDCSGSGSTSNIISAAEWIASNRTPGAPAVANLSFGYNLVQHPEYASDTSLETAVQGLINSGVTVVAAAGNESTDACNDVPARLPSAITVASVNRAHAQSSFSNYGSCVDLYAPGESVNLASISSPTTFVVESGTSFSAPLTSAAAAQVLHDHPAWTPAQVAVDISARASYGMITGARSANKLLNVGALGVYATSSVTIDSTGFGGDTTTAVLNWSPAPATVTYVWARNGTPIAGVTGQTYTLTRADVDQSITVTATASGGGYSTTSATSSAIVAQLGLSITPGAPTIAGGAAVGYTLTATPGTWDPADVVLTYQWRRDGAAISGATGVTYAPVVADIGHALTVAVTGTKTGYFVTTVVSPATASITSASSPLAYEAFVKASYQDFLGRQPTADELASWSGKLSSGTVSKADYLASLSTSNEWLSAIVTKMYRDTLNRDPDPNGLANWVSWLRSGRFTVAQAASLFYSSNEYFTVAAHSDTSTWVQLLYQKLLNRTADSAGLPFWITNTGRYGMDWVAYNFYQSSETRVRRVEVIYQTLLFREPDPVGWPFWTARVLSTGDLQLAWEVANSDEYWDKAHARY